MKTDKKERKLTQLLGTYVPSAKASTAQNQKGNSPAGEGFMVFYCVYLWFLIDRCGFVIDDCQNLHIFSSHDNFNAFACQTMRRRQEAILNGDKIRDMFNKIALNGSYGYDIMNESKYSKVRIVNRHKCFLAHMTPTFRHSEKLADDVYLVESVAKSFKCQTCIQIGSATLDIAKMLYLNLIYNFMYKCIDMDKCHFVEGDTDSMYWAVAGNPSGNPSGAPSGGFKDVIKDKEFYTEHIGDYLTSVFYGVNKQFDSKLDEMIFNKRYGGLSIEKESRNMIALASKLYVIWSDEKETSKAKGCHEKFTHQRYLRVLEAGDIVKGTNRTLTKKDGVMSHLSTEKKAITACYHKMRVSSDGSTCFPLYLDVEE
jgi:hypothetical protein